MLLLRHLLLLTALVAGPAALADASLGLDGGYLYSRLEYASTSTFTMLAKSATFGRAELAYGSPTWDLLARGQMNQMNLAAPSSRTVNENEVSTNSYMGALRWKNSRVWIHLGYQLQDTIYLEDLGSNVFDMKKRAVSMTVMGFKFFGWGNGYKITVDAEGAVPMTSPEIQGGTLKYTMITRGSAKVEFGNSIRFGFLAGINNAEYSVVDTKYYHSDFMVGVTLVFGGGKGGRSSGGRGGDSSIIPKWPL